MAGAEQAGIGAFLSNISTGMQEQQLSKQRKHKLWVACIMEGGDPEACSQIVGYDPGEEGRAGAQGIMAQRKAAERGARMEEESKAALPMKAETAGELGMPMGEVMREATIRPEGATVYPRREDVESTRKIKETLEPAREGGIKPWWYPLLPEEKKPEAIETAAGLRAKVGAGGSESDRERVERIFDKPEDKWTDFEKNMVERYFKEGLTSGQLLNAYINASGIFGNPKIAAYLAPKVAETLGAGEGEISALQTYPSIEKFKEALKKSPEYESLKNDPTTWERMKMLAEFYYRKPWGEDKE